MVGFAVQLLEKENGKWYPAGKMIYNTKDKAIKEAKNFIKESDVAAVVFTGPGRGDVLVAFGGKGMNEKDAMRYGTGTVERLTKKTKVQKI